MGSDNMSKYDLGDYTLVAEGITKRYGNTEVLKDVDFTLKKGEVHALLGANGAGKSTLLKVLDGVIHDHKGDLYVDGNKTVITDPDNARKQGIGMVHQELTVLPNISVQENIFLNRLPKNSVGLVHWKKLYSESKRVLKSIGLTIDPAMQLSQLTVADRQMVEIARIVSMNSPIILLDEPTSALSEAEITRLLELIHKFKDEGRSVVFITHKLDEILKVSDRITILRDGRLIETVNVTDRSKKAEKYLISKMIGTDEGDISAMFPPKKKTKGEIALEVSGLTKDGVYKDINFYAKHGEVCVFTGLKGAKRTEVMRAVFGADKYTSGTIKINKTDIARHSICKAKASRLGMVTEDRKSEGMVALMSIKHNISLSTIEDCSKFGFISDTKLCEKANTYVKKLNIKVPSIGTQISSLSGGNQQKVVLAKWLAAKPEILILDEPTRGIDVGAKIEIYKLIRKMAKQGTAVIVVSSELPEVIGLADRVYVMREGRMVGELEGSDIENKQIMHLMFGHEKTVGGKQNECVN